MYRLLIDTNMLIRVALAALLALGIGGGAWSQSLCEGPFTWGKCPPQTPRIQADQQPQSTQSIQGAPNAPPASQQTEGSNNEQYRKDHTEKTAEDATEYWPFSIMGHRLKITDSLLALFTLFLVVVGVVQGWALIRTVNLARSEFNATHRPHIRIHSVKFHTPEVRREKDLEQVGAAVFYANDGDQEAIIEAINFSFELRQIPLDSDIALQGVAVLPKTPIAGGMRGWFQISDEWDVRTVKLTSDDNSRYFLIGRIVYRAPRGGLREMGFCRHFTWDAQRCRWETHDNPEYEYSY
jgi:hypothetical protein